MYVAGYANILIKIKQNKTNNKKILLFFKWKCIIYIYVMNISHTSRPTYHKYLYDKSHSELDIFNTVVYRAYTNYMCTELIYFSSYEFLK